MRSSSRVGARWNRRSDAVLGSAEGAARDRGSASPIVVAAMAVIVIVSLVAVDGSAVMVASTTTGSVADLAALAAARADRDARAEGESPAKAVRVGCGAAREVASRNGAKVVSCLRGSQGSVDVTIEMRVHAWPTPLRASARAGALWG